MNEFKIKDGTFIRYKIEGEGQNIITEGEVYAIERVNNSKGDFVL